MIRSSELLPAPFGAQHADLRAEIEREPDVLENPGVGLMDLPEALHGVDELRHRSEQFYEFRSQFTIDTSSEESTRCDTRIWSICN